MPKGKVRKVSKKRVSKKRGKRISHKKRKVLKGGDYDPKPDSVGDKILYFKNGEVRYGIIIGVNNNMFKVERVNQSIYPRNESISLDKIIKIFEEKLIDDIGINLYKISDKMLGTKFKSR
jgi:hypothetical protein